MCREHPLKILKYSMKTIWLLIFPLLRGLMNILNSQNLQEMQSGLWITPEVFLNWLKGVWFDLLILALILGYGWLVWYCRKFTVKKGQFYVQDGFIFTRVRIMPIQNISALTIERKFTMKAFKASYVYADVASGMRNSTDIKLMIRQQDESIFLTALPKIRHNKRHNYQRVVKLWKILLFSVIFSSSFSGALYMAMLWFQGGRIARDLMNEFQVTEKLNTVSQEVADHLAGIPPVAVTIGILILFTWLLSFISNLLRYGGFQMESDKRLLFVKSGLVTTRQFYLQNHKINFLDIRQNFITKMLGVFSLAVDCPGYGNQRGSIPICLPILMQKELDATIPLIFPDSRMMKNQLTPPKSSWFGYTIKFLIGFLAVIPAGMAGVRFFPAFEDMMHLIQFMIALPIFWKLVVQVTALLTSGVSISKNHVCMRYCKHFTFYTILAETDCIVKVRIHRYFWHKWSGKCHLVIYFRSETPRRCTLYGMDYQQTREQLHAFLMYPEE